MATWDDITAAVGLALGGDREEGRSALRRSWNQTAESDHAQRCVIAHYLADLETELDAEVAWDEQALANYAHLEDPDLAAVGITHARGLAPSLYLNLGDGYLRQGRLEDARVQLEQGLAHQNSLGNDGYGALIRKGLQSLSARLDAASGAAIG